MCLSIQLCYQHTTLYILFIDSQMHEILANSQRHQKLRETSTLCITCEIGTYQILNMKENLTEISSFQANLHILPHYNETGREYRNWREKVLELQESYHSDK